MSIDFTESFVSRQHLNKSNLLEYVLDQVKLPNGKTAARELILHSGGVVIIPVTETGHFVLVEQFRYATGGLLLEFPAGRLNPAEDPMEAAARELKEETGYSAQEIVFLNSIYPAPGFCTEKLYLYAAKNLTAGVACPDEDEFVKVVELTEAELLNKITKAEITDAKTLAAYTLYKAMMR